MGGIGIWQLVIVLVIIMLVFGTKKLKNIGSDLGGAMKGFQNAMKDGEKEGDEEDPNQNKLADSENGETIDVTAEKVDEKS